MDGVQLLQGYAAGEEGAFQELVSQYQDSVYAFLRRFLNRPDLVDDVSGILQGPVSMKRIRILLADDHMIVREGIRALLEAEDDIEVVGEAETGRQAVQLTQRLRPDVVVMDIGMPLLNGLEATRQILKAVRATRVLILSAHGDDEYIRQAVLSGAAGYLIKETSADLLSKAIREVQKGNAFFSPSIADRVRSFPDESIEGGRVPKRNKNTLSSREVEVLQLIAEGKGNKQVAAELGISIKTVEKHRQHLMSKLDLHDTAGLTRYAIAAGIIESRVQGTIL
jgi:DNA-binding NarL/FixJ family response regulator